MVLSLSIRKIIFIWRNARYQFYCYSPLCLAFSLLFIFWSHYIHQADALSFLLIQSMYVLMRAKPFGRNEPQPCPHETRPINLFWATNGPPESPAQIEWPNFPEVAHIVSKSCTGANSPSLRHCALVNVRRRTNFKFLLLSCGTRKHIYFDKYL